MEWKGNETADIKGFTRNRKFQMFTLFLVSFTFGLFTFYFVFAHAYSGCGTPSLQYCACTQTVLQSAVLGKAALLRQYRNSTIRDFVNVPLPIDQSDMKFECLQGKLQAKSFPVCIFNPYYDIHVSATIKKNGGKLWESENIINILTHLGKPEPDTGFIDIGANIGVFTLAAAHNGHKVVSVEPMPAALRRLKRSLQLGNVGSKVSLVQGGLSNDTTPLYLSRGRLNKGGSHLVPESQCSSGILTSCDKAHPIPLFYMDDLLDVITFRHAAMKIDCEGFEYRVFKNASGLFDKVDITYIEMEWMHHKKFINSDLLRPEAEALKAFFTSRGYKVHSLSDVSQEGVHWKDWPNDIVWKR